MGNFFIVHAAERTWAQARQVFHSGLAIMQELKAVEPSGGVVENGWVCAASFHRHNGSGTPLIQDRKEGGSWLGAIGTWFQRDGYGVGKEARLLNRYLDIGAYKLSEELEGFFVIAIGDARTRELFIITDVVGSCHFYVRSWEGMIALSSSSLVLAALEECSLDSVACQEFLYTGILYEDRTIYQNVRKLGPASVFRLVDGEVQATNRYWRITDLVPNALDGKKAIHALGDVLSQSVLQIGRDFQKPVCDLTGGYDSRAMVSAFLSADLHVGTTVSGLPTHPDVVISRGLAEKVGLSHLHLAPQSPLDFAQAKMTLALTDGECNLVDYAWVMDVHQRLVKRFDISINGSFGELARGYWWEILWPKAGSCNKVNSHRLSGLRYAAGRFDPSLFSPDFRLDLVAHLADVIDRTNTGLFHLPNTMQMDHAYLMMRMQRWQGRIASSTNQIWPCLSPFMFRSVIETVLQTAVDLRRRSLLIRQLLAERQPELAGYPLENGCPALPVTWKNVGCFSPLVLYYGKKVLTKVTRRIGGSNESSDAQRNPVQRLAQDDEVREIMRAEKMRVAQLMDLPYLQAFLDGSLSPHFSFVDQWGRLLTLEYSLRMLESTRTKVQKLQGKGV